MYLACMYCFSEYVPKRDGRDHKLLQGINKFDMVACNIVFNSKTYDLLKFDEDSI